MDFAETDERILRYSRCRFTDRTRRKLPFVFDLCGSPCPSTSVNKAVIRAAGSLHRMSCPSNRVVDCSVPSAVNLSLFSGHTVPISAVRGGNRRANSSSCDLRPPHGMHRRFRRSASTPCCLSIRYNDCQAHAASGSYSRCNKALDALSKMRNLELVERELLESCVRTVLKWPVPKLHGRATSFRLSFVAGVRTRLVLRSSKGLSATMHQQRRAAIFKATKRHAHINACQSSR